MTLWIVRYHPAFSKDLNRLSPEILQIFYKKLKKIKKNPERMKHLSSPHNAYREAITTNFRLIYAIRDNVIILLTLDLHDKAYAKFLHRLQSLE